MTFLVALLGALSLDAAVVQGEPDVDCRNPTTTLEMNHCVALLQRQVEQQLQTYLDATRAKIRKEVEDPEAIIAQLEDSQKRWEDYTQSACVTVYTYWQGGSIRNLMEASCRMELMRERAHHFWRDYLGGNDDDSDQYPEPQRAVYKTDEEHNH